jgi:hypothetical protein
LDPTVFETVCLIGIEAVIVVLFTIVKLAGKISVSPTRILTMFEPEISSMKAVPEIVILAPPAAVPDEGLTPVTVGVKAKLKLETELSIKVT